MNEEAELPAPIVRSFWAWLFRKDSDGDRGFSNLVDLWNGFGIVVSGAAAALASAEASSLALTIALPVAAALVGISFAWAGRSASLLQDKDYAEFIINHGAPPEGYVYSFQLAILTAVAAVFVATLLSAELYVFTTNSPQIDAALNRFLLFLTSWVAARECWGVISFSNKLAIQFYEVRKERSAQSPE